MKTKVLVFFIYFYLFPWSDVPAQVVTYQSNIVIDGVQLVRDCRKIDTYYYLPVSPRLSVNKEGLYEFFLWKYIGGDSPGGGLLHALIQFDLSEDQIRKLEQKLRKTNPNARIEGMVYIKEKRDQSIQIVSSVLNSSEAISSKLIHSSGVILQAGGKIAVTAKLSPLKTSMLWNSMRNPVSDFSVVVKGYYQAQVESYNAVISASMKTIRKNIVKNYKHPISKRVIRELVTNLISEKVIKVETFDRDGEDVNQHLNDITNIVLERILNALFVPVKTTETLNQGGSYFPVKTIKRDSFQFNLIRSTVIDIPFVISGNINLGKDNSCAETDSPYFRVIDLNASDFDNRIVFIQIDDAYRDAFEETVNFASVQCSIPSDGDKVMTRQIVFDAATMKTNDLPHITISQAGGSFGGHKEIAYRVTWKMNKDNLYINVPPDTTQWLTSDDYIVTIQPPFERHRILINADRKLFNERDISSCYLEFRGTLGQEKQILENVLLLQKDVDSLNEIIIYCDPNSKISYSLNWYGKSGYKEQPFKPLRSNYLFIQIPKKNDLIQHE